MAWKEEMLGQAKVPLQVEPDQATLSHYVDSRSSARILWTGLGFASLMLMGISALAVFPSAQQQTGSPQLLESASWVQNIKPFARGSATSRLSQSSYATSKDSYLDSIADDGFDASGQDRAFAGPLPVPGQATKPRFANPVMQYRGDDGTRDEDESVGTGNWAWPRVMDPPGPPQQTKRELWEENDPWWGPGDYAEASRKFRRTVFTHDKWVEHRSSDRFAENIRTMFDSGVARNLRKEQAFLTGAAVAIVLANCITGQYEGFDGIMHDGPLKVIGDQIGPIALPPAAFSTALPALSLLLVFRTNAGYSRWNEARTIWGGIINRCRNICSQTLAYYPKDARGIAIGKVTIALTSLFTKALRNALRGSDDDSTFQAELYEYMRDGLLTQEQVDGCMNAKNRPIYVLAALRHSVNQVELNSMDRAQIDQSITALIDFTGACERIFKTPVPLVYTRHTARFLAIFLATLPLGLWEATGQSWNHLSIIPIQAALGFFLLGIEEIGVQIEEPFSILPLETYDKVSISATMDDLAAAEDKGVWNIDLPGEPFQYGTDGLPQGRR